MVALAARAGAPATAGGCPSLVGGRRDCPAAHRLDGVVLTRALRARRLLAQSDLAGLLRTARASDRWPPRCRSQLVRAKAMAVFAARGAVPVLRWNTRVQPTGDRVQPLAWPRRFRFYGPFQAFKHGRPHEVEHMRRE